MKKYLLVLWAALLLGCSGPPTGSTDTEPDAESDSAPDVVALDAPLDTYVAPSNPPDGGWTDGSFDLGYVEGLPLDYMGGNVLTQPINVYYIWYGNWTDPNVQPILEDFIKNLGASPWYQIDTAYYQQAGVTSPPPTDTSKSRFKIWPQAANVPADAGTEASLAVDADINDAGVDSSANPQIFVNGQVNFIGSVNVGYTRGNMLQDTDIAGIVGDAISANLVPVDLNAVYYVLTSADVQEVTGFCYSYCGWHGNYPVNNQNLRVVYVGDTGSCPEGCSLQDVYLEAGVPTSPNNNWSADSMASVIAHELAESATDPDVNTTLAWIDYDSEEVGDKCAWTYGQPYETVNKSVANIKIGDRDYMIQQNWVSDGAGGHCALHP